MSSDTATNHPQSLAQRMAQGRLPVHEALRYALILAEALRKVHDSGHVHGAVSPACISLTRSGLELMPALGSAGEITPYTAPEVIRGNAPDSRSDIFSFGAIVYEMLAGRPAFKGETAEALARAITDSAPAPSGSPAVDRLLASCLAKDPATRLQRVQKLTLELKLLAVAVRRAEAGSPVRQAEQALRDDFGQLETRMNSRAVRVEQNFAMLVDRVAKLETALKAEVDQKTEIVRRLAEAEQVLRKTGESLARAERAIETARQETTALRGHVAADFETFETALKSHDTAIESTRIALAQTDDLVERVVEALESLQSVVLDRSEELVSAE